MFGGRRSVWLILCAACVPCSFAFAQTPRSDQRAPMRCGPTTLRIRADGTTRTVTFEEGSLVIGPMIGTAPRDGMQQRPAASLALSFRHVNGADGSELDDLSVGLPRVPRPGTAARVRGAGSAVTYQTWALPTPVTLQSDDGARVNGTVRFRGTMPPEGGHACGVLDLTIEHDGHTARITGPFDVIRVTNQVPMAAPRGR